jgi:exportin-2 (importin alpha re-exporter)
MLTSNAIQFLASVADRQQYKSLFEDANTLASICEKIIVPNIEMREVDVELFEDNPEEYIRRDLVGSILSGRILPYFSVKFNDKKSLIFQNKFYLSQILFS